MHEVTRSFASLFEAKIEKKSIFRPKAENVLRHFLSTNEKELMPTWMRTHVFAHRLFGNRGGADDATILSAEETTHFVERLGLVWKAEHLRGQLLQSRWSLQPVYTMVDSGSWDADCKDLLRTWMSDDAVVDGVALLLFGAYFTTGQETIDNLCGWDFFYGRAMKRLASSGEMHQTVRVSLKKAVGDRSRG